jgi:hypothetical protein
MTKYFSLLIIAASLLGLSACEENSSTQALEVFPMVNPNSGGGSTAANPQIVGVSSKVVSKNTYNTIAVMDTDGSHLTHLYTAAYAGTPTSLGSPSWSPDGGSVSFVDGTRSGTTFTNRQLKVMNVSIVNGVPTASNVTTLYSDVNISFSSASWCSLATTNKIAFVVNDGTIGKLYTISANGGSPTLVYTDTMRFANAEWSPDDQSIVIAVLPNPGMSANSSRMRIIDVATGTITLEPCSGVFIADSYSWTRAGADKILYRYAPNNLTTPVAMIYDVATATSTQLYNAQILGSWSPRNDKILCQIGTSTSDLKAINPVNATISTIKTGGAMAWMEWKR